MAQNITLLGASYSDVPAVVLPKTGGGTAAFTDVTDTTAAAADVASGKYFYTSAGVRTQGTGTGGGGSGYTLTNVVPLQTVNCSTTISQYAVGGFLSNATPIEDSKQYLVTFDGTEYVCECGSPQSGWLAVGERMIEASGDYLFMPFLVARSNDGTYYYVSVKSYNSGNHTIKVDEINFLDGGTTLTTKTITSNGTYAASSDSADGYSSVTVNVSGGGSMQAKTNISPTTSSQTIYPDTGYAGLSSVQINAMPSGTAGTPTATKGTVSNHSISVTPSVTNTTGYITGSTKTGTAVTVSASELVSGSETKTANGTYDVTNLASLVVNVSGGGCGLTLLKTTSLGSLSTSSTSATDTGKTMTVTGYNDYDVLVVDVSVDTTTNGRHTSTVSMVYLTGTSAVTTKNTYTVGSNKWNSKLSSSGTGSTRQSTSAYGVYVNAATVSSSTMTLTFYYRYNSNNTGTINGTYTVRVYGVKLFDLIGG